MVLIILMIYLSIKNIERNININIKLFKLILINTGYIMCIDNNISTIEFTKMNMQLNEYAIQQNIYS